jgi:hypothetical protein
MLKDAPNLPRPVEKLLRRVTELRAKDEPKTVSNNEDLRGENLFNLLFSGVRIACPRA